MAIRSRRQWTLCPRNPSALLVLHVDVYGDSGHCSIPGVQARDSVSARLLAVTDRPDEDIGALRMHECSRCRHNEGRHSLYSIAVMCAQ
jgi:hypothetical protein